ncbi:MAG TPA: PEGA domain-containing protein [Polyangia bacterium]|nr:PEGA domain-containing protein [Polyangia bacterium]
MRALCAATVVLLLGGVASAAGTKPKLAALILKTGTVDEDLADNLTEVLIGRLARRGDHEIAGKEELKSKLGVDDHAAAECMQNLGCLGRAGTELGVTTMVVGTLGKRGVDYLYNLNLIDISTGQVQNRVFELVAGGKVDSLIAAVQSTADKLFMPKIEPGALRVTSETRGAMVYLDEAFVGSTPMRRDGIEPGMHDLRVEKDGHLGWTKEVEVPAGATMEIKVPLTALPERKRWPGAFAASCAVVAGLAGVAGVVLEALANQASTGSTRVDAIADASLRHRESAFGIGFLTATAALATTAAVLTIVYRHDIFGTMARQEKAAKSRVAIAPGGSALMVRW